MGQIMTLAQVQVLFQLTMRQPAQAARLVIAMEIPRGFMLVALALLTVLNAIVFSLFVLYATTIGGGILALPVIFESPAVYTLVTGGVSILTILALLWSGRALGGRATLDEMIAVVTWIQVPHLVLQTLAFAVMFAMPALSAMLGAVGNLWLLWMLIHFINVAHRFNSMGRAAAVLAMAAAAGILGLSLILGLIGGAATIGGVAALNGAGGAITSVEIMDITYDI